MGNESRPLISVVVTTFNREQLLKETLKSIIAQTYSHIEIVVVDNYSNYNFLAVIDSFGDDRIKAFQNHNFGVIATNRNFGIQQSTGAYISFCDDDDLWLPQKLEKQLKVIADEQDEQVLVHSNCQCFGPEISSYETKKQEIKSLNDLLFKNDISLSSVLVKRTALVVFEELAELRGVEDFYLWLNLVANGYKVVLIKEALVKYYVSNQSISRNHIQIANLKYLSCLMLLKIRYPDAKVSNLLFLFTGITQLLKYVIKRIRKK